MGERFVATGRGAGKAIPDKAVQVVTPVRAELHRAMKVKAAEEGTTLRALVMRGLRAIGLPVTSEDEKDRRDARGNRRGSVVPKQVPPRRRSP